MSAKEFLNYVNAVNNNEHYGVLPPPINAQEGLDILVKHFLGNDYYTISINNEQANTEAIYEILKNIQEVKYEE